MELSGTIYRLSEAQDISEKFRKREVVIKTDDQYPQTIPVEFVQDRIDLLNSYSEGQQVTISINIRGREWTSPKGEVKFFVSVQGWRIQPLQQGSAAAPASAAAPVAATPAPANTNATEDDDLPF
jgi:single-strand DNA-binding protein